ncbi:hypothetical protein [Cytobacillus horneckiae]|uniref:hypothetical protein n=1 Tax=Cytobacillus horneckiae TaxID=549687 RepID=UPI001F4E7428|nr:hypothetical protein [Cytobacillus horneckiae]MEC1157577.1 hypothetical protein [Cytobacillus horneckiae]MED2939524.1 hypothetical protein [Cytobacillus horneckiae]
MSGGQGANIIQILPASSIDDQAEVSMRQDAVEPVVASDGHIENENEPFISFKQNTVINNNTYCMFKQSVSYFVNDSQLTNKLYGIFLAQTSYIKHCYESSELLDCGIEAVMTTFKATKRKPIRNMAGYYHGVLDRVLDRLMTEVFR